MITIIITGNGLLSLLINSFEYICELASRFLCIKDSKTILDLCSGRSQFLFHVKSKLILNDCKCFGYEKNLYNCLVSELNFFNNKYYVEISEINILKISIDQKYDYIFCDPPIDIPEQVYSFKALKRQTKYANLISKKSHNTWCFVEILIDLLNDNGKGILIMPKSAMKSKYDFELRKALIEDDLVSVVLQFPKELTESRKEKVLLLLDKNKKNKNKIFFYNASNMYNQIIKKQRVDSNENKAEDILQKIVNQIIDNRKKFVQMAPEFIESKNYSLAPEDYLN